jgi:curved DNA-binding protein CbpA
VNPFAALRLPPDPALTDEQVRAAWRAAAAATHPDRADGGNPAAYAAAQAAYHQLRTGWGRSEALADLAVLPHVPPAPARDTGGWHALFTAAAAVLPARIARGRPLRLAARAVIAALAGYAASSLVPGTPAAPAVATGCALWWLLTAKADLAPPPGR